MYRTTGLGAAAKTLAESERQLRVEAERLAQIRRITEAEVVARRSAEDTSELRAKVLTWAPRIVGGMAALIAAYLLIQKFRKRGK